MSSRRFLLSLVSVLALPLAVQAQRGPTNPGNTTPNGPKSPATLTTDLRFVPLVKGELKQTPRGGGFVRQVSKAVVCTFTPNDFAQDYTILHYHWSGLDFGETRRTRQRRPASPTIPA